VPVLWDKQTEQIVSNESSEIIRMFNSAFDAITGNRLDFWPAARRNAIEMINDDIYQHINNGVYRAGFATKALAYDEAVTGLFDALDRIEAKTVIFSAMISPRQIGGFSPHWFGLIRFMLAISNAIYGVLPIIRPCRDIFASYIKCPGSLKRW
jgi:putative glutathione S-transferase